MKLEIVITLDPQQMEAFLHAIKHLDLKTAIKE